MDNALSRAQPVVTKAHTASAADLPSTPPPLVLLPGLGFAPSVWDGLRRGLARHFTPSDMPLPGFDGGRAMPPDANIEQWLDALLPRLPRGKACYLGWSLGGLLALALAARYPERVMALVTIGSNPRFCRDRDWRSGLPKRWFDDFQARAEDNPAAALRRLLLLTAHGEAAPRALAAQLRPHALPGAPGAFASGLSLLRRAELRATLGTLRVPVLQLLGGCDALVPAALATPLRRLSGDGQRIAVLPHAGHAAFLSQPVPVLGAVRAFASDYGILPTPRQRPAPKRIAQRFGAASASYDSAAWLQREAGHWLLEALPTSHRAAHSPECILDLGCGTGRCLAPLARQRPGAQLLAMDISFAMTQRAAARRADKATATMALCAEAKQLPLADDSVDLVFCNLMLQWCQHPQQALTAICRALRPGGWLLFTTFGPDSLWQLRAAFAATGPRQPVLAFQSAADWQAASRASGLQLQDWAERRRERRCADGYEMLRELHALGATASTEAPPPGLAGRTALRRVSEVAAAFGDARGPSFSFQLFRGALQKP